MSLHDLSPGGAPLATLWDSGTLAADTASLDTTSWKNTAAINRVALNVITAGKKFKVGSRLTIYGMP